MALTESIFNKPTSTVDLLYQISTKPVDKQTRKIGKQVNLRSVTVSESISGNGL
jgi:hypothetical protein